MSEKFCLRWNDFESNISVAFREIREEKDFFDCTLSVGDRQLQAHKLILSACSPFFRSVLKKNPHQHPLLYLKGVEFSDLQSVLNFMYHGEVNVAQEDLNSFLAVAEDLKVKGLTQNNSSGDTTPAPKLTERPLDITSRSISTPKIVPPDPPAPKRSQPTPQFTNPQDDDDDIQEVMPVVKTEPVMEQQQPSVTTYQQSQPVVQTTSYSSSTEGHGASGVLTQMGDDMVYGEDDGYDYGGYEEGYEGIEEASTGEINRGSEDRLINRIGPKSVQCLADGCGKMFSRSDSCRRHVREIHMGVCWTLCSL